jgi:hypothetical protein
MARNTSAVFKFQGTIENQTHVKSRRYKEHVRAKKYTHTPFTMPVALAKSRDLLQLCNKYNQPIFRAIRREVYDGELWSRLGSLQFAELKAGRPLGLECLKGFECNLQHKMTDVIAGGYDFSATVAQNQLGIYVRLQEHPKVDDKLPRTGYQLRFVLIAPDPINGPAYKQVALGPLTQYTDELTAVDIPVALPEGGGPCMLLMGIVPHLQGTGPCRVMSDSGMQVVWVRGQEEAVEDLDDGLEGVQAHGVAPAMPIVPATAVVSAVAADAAPIIEITEAEKEGFIVVKAMLRQHIKPHRIAAIKERSCLTVLLDEDDRKPICRLYLQEDRWYIGIFDGEGHERKIEIESVDDLFQYEEVLEKRVEEYEREGEG